jgi:hypothetical protein
VALGQQGDDVRAGVVAGVRVLGTRVAEADRQKVRRGAGPGPAEQLALL